MTECQHFKIQLSSNGLINILHQESRNDFDILVGENHCLCLSYVTAFLSPKLCQNYVIDPAPTEFHVETADPNHRFFEILPRGRGETIDFTPSTSSLVVSIAREFENNKLFFSMKDEIAREINISECYSASDWAKQI
jgi:hypothetical protein